jgi:LysR family transcriptional regulator, carnitine catabolism transcriptional activator
MATSPKPTKPSADAPAVPRRSAPHRLGSQVTIKQLRAFAAVAREGSFTAAALQLFLSQSALSALVRGLEAGLGLRLLDRTTRRLELTAAGQDLMPTVQRLLDDLDRMAGELHEVSERKRGRVRLGATPLLAVSLLPPLMAAYHERYPGVDLRLLDASADVLLGRLREGELDLAVATFDRLDPDLVATSLLSDPMLLACPRDHALASRREVGWAQLLDQPLLLLKPGSGLRALTDRCFASLEPTAAGMPRPAQEVTHVATALALAAAGLGVAIVPAYALRVGGVQNVVGVPLVAPRVTREVCLVHLKQRTLSPATLAMRQHLVEHMSNQHQAARARGPRRKG